MAFIGIITAVVLYFWQLALDGRPKANFKDEIEFISRR
jgi:hypothetical protein